MEIDLRRIDPTDWRRALGPESEDPEAGTFVVVCNHSPLAILDACQKESGGRLTWKALQTGPEVWRFVVSRAAAEP